MRVRDSKGDRRTSEGDGMFFSNDTSKVYDNPTFSSKLKQVAQGIFIDMLLFLFVCVVLLLCLFLCKTTELGLKLHKAGKEPNAKYLYTPVVCARDEDERGITCVPFEFL